MLDTISNEEILAFGLRAGVVLLILIISVILAKLVKKAMLKKARMLTADATPYTFMSHMAGGLIYFIGIGLAIYSVPSLRGLATSIFAGSGVLLMIIGFASPHAFANIAGGIFISIFKPFRLGDRIRFINKEVIGTVEDITLRHTVIRTFDNKRIIVPNSVISGEILENAHIVDEKTLQFFDIGIGFSSDIDKAMQIIKEEALRHPNYLDNRTEEQLANNDEPVKVRILSYGDSTVNLRAWIWAADPAGAFDMGCDLNKTIKERFDKEGVELPYPYHNIITKT